MNDASTHVAIPMPMVELIERLRQEVLQPA
jgi:hypothetical protein